jgi:hypothetical protein
LINSAGISRPAEVSGLAVERAARRSIPLSDGAPIELPHSLAMPD